jgi:hypothetical protein
MKQVLITRFGFAASDIVVLTDAQATRKGILDTFRSQLIAPARPGDVVVFFFAGHGQRVKERIPGNEPDGKDETLVPSDYLTQREEDGARTNIIDDEIGELLKQLSTRMKRGNRVEGNITVAMDCCHSGSVTRGNAVTRGRDWDEQLDGPEPPARARGEGKGAGGLLPRGEAEAEDYVLLSACQDAESAFDKGPDQGGAFTCGLTRALTQATAKTTYRELLARVSAEVSADFPQQHPQLEGSIDEMLFSGLVQAAPIRPVVQDVPRVKPRAAVMEGDVVQLSVGSLHGATVGSKCAIYQKDAERRLAQAEIVTVGSITSEARLTGLDRPALKREDLIGAPAVETEHNYGERPLRVLLQGAAGLAQSLSTLGALTTAGVSKENYDVRLTRAEDKLVFWRRGDDPKSSPPDPPLVTVSDDQKGWEKAKEALLGAWRWRYLTELKPDVAVNPLTVEMRLVKVQVKTNDQGAVTELLPGGTVVKPNEVLSDGGYIMIDLRNPKENGIPLWATILELGVDGSIGPIFPDRNKSNADFGQIPADGNWRRLPMPYVYRLTAPYGIERFKVIATRKPADFSPLFQAPLNADGELAVGARGVTNPLDELLLNARTGRRGTVLSGAIQDWTSSDVPFGVRS